MDKSAVTSLWQRGDRLVNTVTGESGKVGKLVRQSPVHHPTVIISLDDGGVSAGSQQVFEEQGWKRQ